MSKGKFVAAGALAMVLAGGAYVSNGSEPTPQQAASGSVQVVSAATSTETPVTTAPAPATAYAAFSGAAERNTSLSREITWTFGGKTQRGWALHGALVAHMVGTDAEPATPEFAAAVADWQKKNRISPADGVVTRDVWLRMMKALQSARAFDATQPPESELVLVEASEWWDQSRPAENRYLRRDAYDAYKRMVVAARAELGSKADGYFGIISGHRSAAYQAGLRARAGNPKSTAGLAVRSPHFTGRAIDIYVGGEPVSTADSNRAIQVETPAFKWLARNAHRFGFRPYFYEPWHWEYQASLDASR
jgi:hypothetical protein